MLTSIKQRMDREDEGFTLIELMVVLLIIAILLAIAIPTFLGARNTANARSTQENLRNALTAEQTQWTSNQVFATGLGTLEPSLTWLTTSLSNKGAREVSVSLFDETVTGANAMTTAAGSTTLDGVALFGYAKDNNCYAIYQSNNSSLDFTAFAEYPSASNSCAAPLAPTAAGASGTASGHVSTAAATTWWTSF